MNETINKQLTKNDLELVNLNISKTIENIYNISSTIIQQLNSIKSNIKNNELSNQTVITKDKLENNISAVVQGIQSQLSIAINETFNLLNNQLKNK